MANKEEMESPIIGKTFDQWLGEITGEISRAQEMIKEGLSSDPSNASIQATSTEDIYTRMVDINSEAERWLEWFEYKGFMGLDMSKTVYEKQVYIKVFVAKQKMLCDKTKGLCASLQSRMRRSQRWV